MWGAHERCEGPRHHHEAGRGFPGFHRHGFGGFGPPWARGKRARRGNVRSAVLHLLAERPMHGYEVIQELEERSGGMWRPSPGSVYPTLQMLEDEGMVAGQDEDGKRVYAITDAGREQLESRRGGGTPPWEMGDEPEAFEGLRRSVFQVGAAAMQLAEAGSPEQVGKATEILGEARRKLYSILAEG